MKDITLSQAKHAIAEAKKVRELHDQLPESAFKQALLANPDALIEHYLNLCRLVPSLVK